MAFRHMRRKSQLYKKMPTEHTENTERKQIKKASVSFHSSPVTLAK